MKNDIDINVGSFDFTNDSNIVETTLHTLQECKDTCSLGQLQPNCMGFTYDADKGECEYYDAIKEHRLVKDSEHVDLYIAEGHQVAKRLTTCKTVICGDEDEPNHTYQKDDKQKCKNDVCTKEECCTVPDISYNEYKDMIPYEIQPIQVIKNSDLEGCQKECDLQSQNRLHERCLGFDFNTENKECQLYNEIQFHDPIIDPSKASGLTSFYHQEDKIDERHGTCNESRFGSLCSNEWISDNNKTEHTCNEYDCGITECCQKTCKHYSECGSDKQLKPNGQSIVCTDNQCSKEQCCDKIIPTTTIPAPTINKSIKFKKLGNDKNQVQLDLGYKLICHGGSSYDLGDLIGQDARTKCEEKIQDKQTENPNEYVFGTYLETAATVGNTRLCRYGIGNTWEKAKQNCNATGAYKNWADSHCSKGGWFERDGGGCYTTGAEWDNMADTWKEKHQGLGSTT